MRPCASESDDERVEVGMANSAPARRSSLYRREDEDVGVGEQSVRQTGPGPGGKLPRRSAEADQRRAMYCASRVRNPLRTSVGGGSGSPASVRASWRIAREAGA